MGSSARPPPILDTLGQFHWDAESYLDRMLAEVVGYERLQEKAAEASQRTEARAILELGTGTGETARRLLAAHPQSHLTGLDSSESMLAAARRLLDADRVDLRLAGIEDPLPEGPFDLVVAALVVHHLEGEAKAELFRRVHAALTPAGRFVLADVVVPERPEDAITPLGRDYDYPSTAPQQVHWLQAAGFSPSLTWQHRDLAVIVAEARATRIRSAAGMRSRP